MITIEAPYTKKANCCFQLDEQEMLTHKTIAVPYVSWLHTHDEDVLQKIWGWPKYNLASIYARPHKQSSKTTNVLRQNTYNACTSSQGCVAMPYNSTLQEIIQTYLSSTFCLHPQGDTPTRAGIFDSLASLCIPVFFSGCEDRSVIMDTMYHPFLSKEFRKDGIGNWSISISIQNVHNFTKYLNSIPKEMIQRMKHNIRKQIPQFIYTHVGNQIIQTFEEKTQPTAK
jgi:hypothetical protein